MRYGSILCDAKIKLIKLICLGGCVWRRFRKIIFGYNCQRIRKFTFNIFNTTKKLLIVYINKILKPKNMFFFLLSWNEFGINFYLFWWLISWLFSRFLEGVFKCLLNFRHESGNKSDFSELFNILWNQLDAVFSFIFFTWRNQNQNGTTEWPSVEQRSKGSQTC